MTDVLLSVLLCGMAMAAWSVFVDKVHRNPSTGIDWSRRRPLAVRLCFSAAPISAFDEGARRLAVAWRRWR